MSSMTQVPLNNSRPISIRRLVFRGYARELERLLPKAKVRGSARISANAPALMSP